MVGDHVFRWSHGIGLVWIGLVLTTAATVAGLAVAATVRRSRDPG